MWKRQTASYLPPLGVRISIVHRKLNSTAGKPFNWADKAAIYHTGVKWSEGREIRLKNPVVKEESGQESLSPTM